MDAEWREYACAYCGEVNETFVDPTSGARQSYVEDCKVCCRPNVVRVEIDSGNGTITVESAIEE